jgi:hypothetical protein
MPTPVPVAWSKARWHSEQTVPSWQTPVPQIPQRVIERASFIRDNLPATGYWQMGAMVHAQSSGSFRLFNFGVYIGWNRRILTARVSSRTENTGPNLQL